MTTTTQMNENHSRQERDMVLHQLLYTMQLEARRKLMASHPALYNKMIGREVVKIELPQ